MGACSECVDVDWDRRLFMDINIPGIQVLARMASPMSMWDMFRSCIIENTYHDGVRVVSVDKVDFDRDSTWYASCTCSDVVPGIDAVFIPRCNLTVGDDE